MDTLKELDTVLLVHDIPVYNLKRGDIGTVVHCYADGRGVEVEFVTGEGETIAVLTLGTDDVRRMRGSEILHARDLAA